MNMSDKKMTPQEREDINFILETVEKLPAEKKTFVKGITVGLAYDDSSEKEKAALLQQ